MNNHTLDITLLLVSNAKKLRLLDKITGSFLIVPPHFNL